MKHLNRLVLASFFIMSFTLLHAQNDRNPWAISIGVNAVDYFPTGEDAPLGGYFEDFFNVDEHYNILPALSRISVARNIGGGFYFEAAGSVNKIEKFGNDSWDDLMYFGLDGTFNYGFGKEDGWFDPVLGVGGGYTWVGDDGAATLDGQLGFNFWLSDNIAFTLQTTYKHAFADDANSHFQHVAGIKFAFGGMDTDGDGIYDKDDACPEVPGLPEFDGCPDSDGDGIPDSEDRCPNTPGLAEFDGCPDTDGDGIPDIDDDCPNVAGLASLNGCPDADGDGVIDSEDECPNEAGPAENNGCPYEDRDNDGVLDKDDKCPDVFGTVENDGCPEPSVEVIKELNDYSRTILFDLNKSTIRDESDETLQSINDIMEEYSNSIFHIGGHTDSTGADSYNMMLSKKRAAAVKDWLEDNGIPASRLTSEGYGETKPIATNSTAKGRQENRRVEISLDKEKEMKNNTSTDSTNTGMNNQ